MKDLKHTPGPWIADIKALTNGKPSKIAIQHISENHFSGKHIADITPKHGIYRDEYYYPIEECEANAKLIAAAPEMLEALKAMTEHYVDLVDSGDAGSWNPEEEDIVKKSREIIQKAIS